MDANTREWLTKNYAASAAHGHGRVGRRVAPESAAATFSDRNDGQQSFSQQPSYIRAIRGKIFALIRVHWRLRELKWLLAMFRVGFYQVSVTISAHQWLKPRIGIEGSPRMIADGFKQETMNRISVSIFVFFVSLW
jgi:hypothetical protein